MNRYYYMNIHGRFIGSKYFVLPPRVGEMVKVDNNWFEITEVRSFIDVVMMEVV